MSDRINVTAAFCFDPPPGRSALDGYVHIGQNMSHRLYTEAELHKRKYQSKRASDARRKERDALK